ncbi:putative inactive leucine-rich repeat receptor-like protein kinase [Carex littledalei]|uniref:Putative inactive leucine-rich repeat receptor-like protein kinase n=1 Tax=Carex littledalei TaxID=544730 RepID=A0A833QIT8_9POAL|nr:putative inactive leucine-rich repeat receptor-like protein kinase [Carex littledalei]
MATSLLQCKHSSLLILFTTLLLIPLSSQTSLNPAQIWSLLRIQHLLNYPMILKPWHTNSTFCNLKPNPHFTIVCYSNSITQLHITGNPFSPSLPKTFSMESFVTTLTRFPDLKVLSLTSLSLWGPLPTKIARLSNLEILNMSSNSLYGTIPQEIANLTNLQTLILDHNLFSGPLLSWINSLQLLAVLSLKNNSLNGTLPNSLSSMTSLRIIDVSLNDLSGDVPDLTELTNLEVLDLVNNSFGPQFPKLGIKLETIVLKNNKFGGSIPANLESYYFLQRIDVSSNKFVGPFPPSLLSLPSIHYVNIAGNRFTGMLFKNSSCNDQLEFVDLSDNLLSGAVPSCLDLGSDDKSVFYSHNCLSVSGDPTQHPDPFCQTQALAAGILPEKKRHSKFAKKVILAICVVVGVVLCALLVGVLVLFLSKQKNVRKIVLRPPKRLKENSGSTVNSSLAVTDSRYISPTIKLGALGIPSYRTFSLEEIEAATNNFDTSSFIGECSNGQMYRGSLTDGSLVAIRCLKLKKKQASINFKKQIDIISKLRHRHLTSALGHCFEYYLDDSTVSRIFFIFEFAPNGNLRSNISHGVARQRLTWPQRISAAIGVAKGVQFLHGGIIPGLFGNNLKISNVLLDHNFVAKLSCYNLPIIEQSTQTETRVGGTSNGESDQADSLLQGEKVDVYDFGVILLEILCGRPIQSHYEVGIMKNQLQLSLTGDRAARRRLIDPVVNKSCSDESLKTVMEICMRCLLKEPLQRPSVEDVLWNLQFAAQVLSQSCEASPLTPSLPRRS